MFVSDQQIFLKLIVFGGGSRGEMDIDDDSNLNEAVIIVRGFSSLV